MSDIDQQPATAPNAVPVPDPSTLPNVSRRHLIMGAGMLAIGGAAYARMPKRRFPNIKDEQFDAMFPKSFGDWRVLPSSELIMPPEGDLTIGFAHAAYQLRDEFLMRSRAAKSFEVRSLDELRERAPEADVLVVSGLWRNDLLPRLPKDQMPALPTQ